jgi:hypothetical protein
MSIGSIDDLAIHESQESSSFEIVVAGGRGALIVDPAGTIKTQVQYQLESTEEKMRVLKTNRERYRLGDIQIIDIEGDHNVEYLGRGSIDGAAVFDSEGKRLWSYGKSTGEKTSIDDLAAGDLDGDGVAEFVAVWHAVELFDRYGALKWRREAKHGGFQIEVVDTDGDGKNEIVIANGDLVVRDSSGTVTREIKMPFYLAHFDICSLPASGRVGILAVEEGYVWLMGFDGKVAAKFNAPLSEFEAGSRKTPGLESIPESVYKARGTWVKLNNDQPGYLVVVTEFAAIDRSVLYVYTPSGQIAYQEVMPERCASITALPEVKGAPQGFLVGGSGTVWLYRTP